MTDLMYASASFATTFVLTSTTDELWLQLLISIVSALIFGIINIGGKILSSWLLNKGIINEEQKKALDEEFEDLADNGKIDNSNDK